MRIIRVLRIGHPQMTSPLLGEAGQNWVRIDEVKKKNVIIFHKEKGNTFTLLINFVVKSLRKEQSSTNLLL